MNEQWGMERGGRGEDGSGETAKQPTVQARDTRQTISNRFEFCTRTRHVTFADKYQYVFDGRIGDVTLSPKQKPVAWGADTCGLALTILRPFAPFVCTRPGPVMAATFLFRALSDRRVRRLDEKPFRAALATTADDFKYVFCDRNKKKLYPGFHTAIFTVEIHTNVYQEAMLTVIKYQF